MNISGFESPVYELLDMVGSGAHGTVWRARDKRRGGLVAIKRVHPGAAAAEAIAREVSALADVRHPNVLPLLDVVRRSGGCGDALALISPWIDGGSLQRRIGSQAWSVATVAGALAPVADALAYCHERGVVHGDVSPANILFTSDGAPVLGDFGAAWCDGGQGGRVSGSIPYAAPEVRRGEAPGSAADVYSLAVVCMQLLDDRSFPQLPAGGLDQRRGQLDAVLRQASHRDSSQRPDAAALAEALHRAANGEAVAQRAAEGAGLTSGAARGEAHVRTQEFGPRPPQPGGEGNVTGPPAWPLFVGAAALVVLVVLGWGQLADRSSRPTLDAHPAASADPACPAMPTIPAPRGAQRLNVDVQGDGCPLPVVVASHVATDAGKASTLIYLRKTPNEPLQTLAVGETGDEVLFGRWNCARPSSPAVYRPSTGEVYYFGPIGPAASSGVPGPADGPHPTGVDRGHLCVVRDPRGCDIVQVDPN